MKKFIFLMLVTVMLAVPVYGDGSYTPEKLVMRAKEVCQINGDALDFQISSTYEAYGMKFYNYQWKDSDKGGSIDVRVGSDGIVYSYYDYKNYDEEKVRIYTDKEAIAKAEVFLQNALKDRYKDVAFDYLESDSESYTFIYSIMFNGVEYNGSSLRIGVNKYSNNVTYYYYPEDITCIKNNSFDGKKSAEEAESIMKNNVELGYFAEYDYGTKKYNVKLLYRMKDYLIKAEDLKPLTSSDLIVYRSSVSEAAAESKGSDKGTLTPAEIQGIEKMKNAVSADRAIKTFNTVFEQNITKNDVTVDYEKEYISDKYNVILSSRDINNPFSATIDYKGRITAYYRYKDADENKIGEDEIKARAEALVERLESGYALTSIEKNNDSYNDNSFVCNVIRNGKISFSEYINISTDDAGNITSFNANYLPDEIFNIDTEAKISEAEAYAIAVEYYGFKPYYGIKVNYNEISDDYEAVPVYGFDERFSIDAVNGEILNFNGQKIRENGVKNYTDINNQWYADIATNLAYMGCTFEGDEFKGNNPLTYGALREITNDIYYFNNNIMDKDENALITRYEFAEYMVECINIKNVNRYNEIYIKPFEDVDFEHTGTVAILKAMGIVGGESFRGNDNITRGEAAAMIYRYMLNM